MTNLVKQDTSHLQFFITLSTAPAQTVIGRSEIKVSCPDSVLCTSGISTFALLIHSALFQVVDKNNDVTDYPLFALAEAIYMSWFTFELLVRLVSYVNKMIMISLKILILF